MGLPNFSDGLGDVKVSRVSVMRNSMLRHGSGNVGCYFHNEPVSVVIQLMSGHGS